MVPFGQGVLVLLNVFNSTTSTTDPVDYFAQFIGAYDIASGGFPFAAPNNDSSAGNTLTATTCAEYCAGVSLSLSANYFGDCYCGDTLNSPDLTATDEANVDHVCDGASNEKCGGLPRYIDIIFAAPTAQLDIVFASSKCPLTRCCQRFFLTYFPKRPIDYVVDFDEHLDKHGLEQRQLNEHGKHRHYDDNCIWWKYHDELE